MVNRRLTGALISAAAALGLATTAAGQAAPAVERSGATYHIPVCPGPAADGTARCHAHVVTDRQGRVIVFKGPPGGGGGGGTPKGYGPSQLQSAYGVGGLASDATIAIVDAYGYNNAESDLAVYRSQFGLSACTTANGCFRKVNQRGQTSYPRQNTGWAQETALDLDMVSAICPSCKILLVEADSNNLLDLGEAEGTAASLGANVISNSYGASEFSSEADYAAYWDQGIPITVSSGDSGYGVQFPAAANTVTAVGGTSLRTASNTRGWSESAWSGAGSGCSAYIDKPIWQTAGCASRTVADVSAVADPNTGVAVYAPVTSRSSGWLVFGGTSVAAPIIAAVYGLGGSGDVGSPYSHTDALNDVTSGSNGSCGGSYLCTAGPGYDGPTGLGTPKGPVAF